MDAKPTAQPLARPAQEQQEVVFLKSLITDVIEQYANAPVEQNKKTEQAIVDKLRIISAKNFEGINLADIYTSLLASIKGIIQAEYITDAFWASNRVPYKPSILAALDSVHTTIMKRQEAAEEKQQEEAKRRAAEQQAHKPSNTEIEKARREAEEAAQKAIDLEEKISADLEARKAAENAREAAKEKRRIERDTKEDQRRRDEAEKKEARRQQKEQDEADRELQREARMKQVVSQAVHTTMVQVGGEFLRVLDVLPQNFRGIAMSAAGQDSLLLTGVSSNTSQHQDQPAIEPKKELSAKLSLVYNAAQGTNLQLSDEAKVMRIKIRYLQLLLKLRPRDLPISIIIPKARALFSALDVALAQDDLVDGHLADFERSVENLADTRLSAEEQQQFCAFAEQSDLNFSEDDKAYFSTFDVNSIKELEAVEKKCRLQFFRKLEANKIQEWLGEGKAPVINALLQLYKSRDSLYKAANPSTEIRIEQLTIKFLILLLVLHKNDQTVKTILAEAEKFLGENSLTLSEELAKCLSVFREREDKISDQRLLTPTGYEIFEALFEKPVFFRADQNAHTIFLNKGEGRANEKWYKDKFLGVINGFKPQAPKNGFHSTAPATKPPVEVISNNNNTVTLPQPQ